MPSINTSSKPAIKPAIKYPAFYPLDMLLTGWHVDQAILHEPDKLVVILFGKWSVTATQKQADILARIQEKLVDWVNMYACDTETVRDFGKIPELYELYEDHCVMFFWRNSHMMVDLGTGNNNKVDFLITNKQELIDICEVVYRAGSKGKGLAVSPRDYSSKLMY